MADLTITAASDLPSSGATYGSGIAGVAITAGQALYLDSGTNTLKLANALTSAATAACVGIASENAAAGQPVRYQLPGGDITIGATLTVGGIYVLSGANSGGIAPVADLTTGWYPVVLLIARTTTIATINNATQSTPTPHA